MIGLHMKSKYGLKLLFDMRGFWADERIEGNIWNKKNLIFNLIYNYFKRKEIKLFSNADYTVSLTERGKKEVHGWLTIKKQPIKVSFK